MEPTSAPQQDPSMMMIGRQQRDLETGEPAIPSTIPESPATPTLDPQLRPQRNAGGCCREWALRCMCFPIVLVATMVLALVLIVFGAVPLAIFSLLLITFYYCCTREPIPFRVLLRALFDGDENNNNNGSENSAFRNGTPQWTTEDIESSLIRRLCLGKWNALPADSNTSKDLSKYPKHAGKVYWEREGLDGDPVYYLFTEPLSLSHRTKKVVEVEGVRPVAHYLRQLSTHHPVHEIEDDANEDGDIQLTERGSASDDGESKRDRTLKERIKDAGDDCSTSDEEEQEAVPPLRGFEKTAKTKDASEGEADGTVADKNSTPVENDCEENDEESKRSAGASCDICLLEYDEGDVVAWSTNKKCRHAFHIDCLVDWIARKPTCPSCRQDYRISAAPHKRGASERSVAPAGISSSSSVDEVDV